MPLSFSEHLALLDLHGRAAVDALGQLRANDRLPPRDEPVQELASAHWATLEIWAWSLENLAAHWSTRPDPVEPAGHDALVASTGVQLDRLATSLRSTGPDADIDYFGRPGTVAQVGRLLAHEAIVMAHAAGLASGRAAPALSTEVARDGVDHTLASWASSVTGVLWRQQPLAIRSTDTGDDWYLSVPEGEADPGDFRLASPQTPAASAQGPAADLLWWVHGYPTPEGVVSVTGNDPDVRALLQTFLHPVDKAPHKKRRWFG